MAHDVRKPVFDGVRTTKAQTSLGIRAVWLAPLLFAFWKVPYLSMLQAKFQFLARLCSLGDWLQSRFHGNLEDRFCHDQAHIMFILIQKRFPTFGIPSFLFHRTSAHVLMSFQVKFSIKFPATIWTNVRPIFCMCHIMFFELRLIRKPFPTFAAIVFTSSLSTFLLQLWFIFHLFLTFYGSPLCRNFIKRDWNTQ